MIKNCCDNQEIIETFDGSHVCFNCGIVQLYLYEKEISYTKKVIYKKNDYILKKIKKLELNLSNNETTKLNDQIIEMFNKITDILLNKKLINKYSLNYNFIIYKILEKLNHNISNIKITKSEKLMKKYITIWNDHIEQNL